MGNMIRLSSNRDAYRTDIRFLEARPANSYRNVHIWSSACFRVRAAPTLVDFAQRCACWSPLLSQRPFLPNPPTVRPILVRLSTDPGLVYFIAVYKSLNCIGVESLVATAIQYIFLILYEMGRVSILSILCRRSEPSHPFRYARLELD